MTNEELARKVVDRLLGTDEPNERKRGIGVHIVNENANQIAYIHRVNLSILVQRVLDEAGPTKPAMRECLDHYVNVLEGAKDSASRMHDDCTGKLRAVRALLELL